MAVSSGWSKPVWYLFATIRMFWSSCPNTPARSLPRSSGFMDASVTSGTAVLPIAVTSGSGSEPENATRVCSGSFSRSMCFWNARWYFTADARDPVTTMAFARPPSSFFTVC